MSESFNLDRFVTAQEGVYQMALTELREGHKRAHWMWFIFPQLKSLGRSSTSKFYGISGLDEASAYLDNPTLAQHLREACSTILALPTTNPAEIFGKLDSLKLCSSMTLFDRVTPNDVFADVINKFFNGMRDELTLDALQSQK